MITNEQKELHKMRKDVYEQRWYFIEDERTR
jgi:hypothetical protein